MFSTQLFWLSELSITNMDFEDIQEQTPFYLEDRSRIKASSEDADHATIV